MTEEVANTPEEVRRVLADELGGSRADNCTAETSLVRSGLISSLEIVAVAAALERHFSIRIPDDALTIANFDSLGALTALVARQRGGEVIAVQPPSRTSGGLFLNGIRPTTRRPIAFVVLLVCALLVADLLLKTAMQGPLAASYASFLEGGRRLYPVGGSYSQDDLSFSVSHHRAVAHPGRGPRIGVFGDSGTIGSFVPAEEAIAGVIETVLRRQMPNATVENLAYFMQFLPKDLMIFERVLQAAGENRPFDVVVFTLGDPYFNRAFIEGLLPAMPYLSLNADLLRRFAGRFSNRDVDAAFQSIAAELDRADRKLRYPGQALLERHSALFHYAPYFRYLITEVLFSKRPFDYAYSIGRKPMFSPVPPKPPADFDISLGLPESYIDRRIITILDATIAMLNERGAKVILYLKPRGPNEWRHLYNASSNRTDKAIAEEICARRGCQIIDLRFSISGTQFTDSLAHYSAPANALIGETLARTILRELKP